MLHDLEMVGPRVGLLTLRHPGREACLVKRKLPQLHTETDTIAHCARSCFSFNLFLTSMTKPLRTNLSCPLPQNAAEPQDHMHVSKAFILHNLWYH